MKMYRFFTAFSLVVLLPNSASAVTQNDPGKATRDAERAAEAVADHPSVGNVERAKEAAEKASDAYGSESDRQRDREEAAKKDKPK